MVREIKRHVHIPVVAIGGIDLGNLEAHGKNFMEIIASTSLL